MATSPIRFKNAGTGSARPADPQADPFSRVFDIVDCYKTQKFLEDPLPWKAIDQGLPCFRPGGESGLEILDPENEAWHDFLVWWTNRYPDQMDAYNYAVAKATEALSALPGSGSNYIFAVCLPRLAGNIILHRRVSPFHIFHLPRIHVYPFWYASSWQQPLKVTARWDNLNCDLSPSNRLAVFWQRQSSIATQWATYNPGAGWDDIVDASPTEAEGDISNNGHPWPIFSEENLVTGIVPVQGSIGEFVIPLSRNESANTLTYLIGNDGFYGYEHLLDMRVRWPFHAEPYAAWKNVNPAQATGYTSERTSVNLLPTPDATSGAYLCGRYLDPETNEIIIIKCNQYQWVGGVEFSDGTEHPVVDLGGGLQGATVAEIPCGGLGANGGRAWNIAADTHITPGYLTRLLPLIRTFYESVMPAYMDGPIVEIEVDTGTGGDYAAVKNTATIQFYCDGYPNILPLGDTPEADEIKIENGIVTIKINYAQYFEVDAMGMYYAYQRKKFRYVLTRYDYTRTEWTLYPKTLSATGLIVGPPDDPGEYIGY